MNLTQVSTLARAVREKEKTEKVSASRKREILSAIKRQNSRATEKTVVQMLALPIIERESVRIQKDESVRHETTFNKEQEALLEEVKSLISHTHPNPSLAQVFEYLAKHLIRTKTGKGKKNSSAKSTVTAAAAVSPASNSNESTPTSNQPSITTDPRYIPEKTKKLIRQKHPTCAYKHEGQSCGSTFQLQFDHIQSIWAGGTSEPENLQRLCSAHNRSKYREETRIRRR